ncbi:MAG: VWA domain-containing protein [Candidatus Cloacimonetes bacterium]|nr:VWA domain-containing protein [Candidatus Cloacimonadota bacterium]
MNKFLKIALTGVILFSVVGLLAKDTAPKVELAILLDTSGSMEGLIEQAKTQLWKIVNELALSKRDGATIELYVALYEYGKSSIPAEEGYIRMIVELSQDLDKISEELFILRTNGGDEYCGQVIQSAVSGLLWSESNEELKIIFIAGNEPFTQGKVDYKEACKQAISKGIIVNTIFCGDYKEGIDTWWKDGADRADGKYINIDQNQQIVHIEAPQDEEIMQLSGELNKTYIAYGREGKKFKERQAEQDKNAMALGAGVYTQRAVTKSTGQYKNIAWDLVDAEEEGAVNIEELKEEELPEEMKGMNSKERKAYVEEKAQVRKELQEKINKLNIERRKYVAEQRSQLQDNTLDAAIINAIIEQAQKKNYKFE